MMPRCLAQPCPLSLCASPSHAVVYGISHLLITFHVVRGVELYDTAVSGTAGPAPPLLTACIHCCVLVPSCWIRRYPLLFLVTVLSGQCCGVVLVLSPLSAGVRYYPLTEQAVVYLDRRRIQRHLFPSRMPFGLAVLATSQLNVRVLRCVSAVPAPTENDVHTPLRT